MISLVTKGLKAAYPLDLVNLELGLLDTHFMAMLTKFSGTSLVEIILSMVKKKASKDTPHVLCLKCYYVLAAKQNIAVSLMLMLLRFHFNCHSCTKKE
jgi:hypothetical protein